MSRYLPLTPQNTANQRWNRFTDYRYAQAEHVVAVTAPEVSRIAAHLPMAFIRREDGSAQLVALLGLEAGVNHCLDEDSSWKAGYVPALLRAHPFRMLPPKGGKPTERTLCFDADSPWISGAGKEPFFQPRLAGVETPAQLTSALQQVVNFLLELEKHFYKTDQAVRSLDQLDLLKPLDLSSIQGRPIEGVLQVDESRLNQLGDEHWLQLRRQGGVALAYAQMISTQQLPTLRSYASGFVPAQAATDELDLDQLFGGDQDMFKF